MDQAVRGAARCRHARRPLRGRLWSARPLRLRSRRLVYADAGQWPAVADVTPVADVVTVFHVAYNVGEILPFLAALNSHARKRVVIEVPVIHPMSNMNEGWKHFWNLIRPTVPAASDLITVLDEMGIKATIEYFESEILLDKKVDGANGFIRRRLCLPEERQDEVDAFVAENPMPERRKLAVIWWDVQ